VAGDGTLLKLRIAFLTPEFVADPENDAMGGLAAFVNRISTVIADLGHEVHVFAASETARTMTVHGVHVEEVPVTAASWLTSLRRLVPKRRRGNLGWLLQLMRISLTLTRTFQARDREAPFDIVHTSDYGFTGLFIRRRTGLAHVTRSSRAADLFEPLDGHDALHNRLAAFLERRVLSRADHAYAPSRFVASHLESKYGLRLATVRPPFAASGETPAGLPGPHRYLAYSGVVTPRKGTDVIARALPIVWRVIPDFRMIWAGVEIVAGELERYRAIWREQQDHVQWMGPLSRAELHPIVRNAVATVVPSRGDNLPNSAIESLSFGIPVIGSNGASIDEIVDRRCGELVPIGDAEALAAAMVRAWLGTASWNREGFRRPDIFREMDPRFAAEALIRFASAPSARRAPE
jgi:glycosyltransferase involved in cell wall biosynthesis